MNDNSTERSHSSLRRSSSPRSPTLQALADAVAAGDDVTEAVHTAYSDLEDEVAPEEEEEEEQQQVLLQDEDEEQEQEQEEQEDRLGVEPGTNSIPPIPMAMPMPNPN